MSPTTALLGTDTDLTVMAWHDPVVDDLGLPVRGTYVEVVWAGVLGPTATAALRFLAPYSSLPAERATLDLPDLAATLGVSTSVLLRALSRLVRFGFVRRSRRVLEVRVFASPVPAHHVSRLSRTARAFHAAAMATLP
jgi:hypothetical protein